MPDFWNFVLFDPHEQCFTNFLNVNMHNRVENNNSLPKNHDYSRNFRNARLLMIQKMSKNFKVKFDPVPTPSPQKFFTIWKQIFSSFIWAIKICRIALPYSRKSRFKIFRYLEISWKFTKKNFFFENCHEIPDRFTSYFFNITIFQICFGIPRWNWNLSDFLFWWFHFCFFHWKSV